MLLSTKDLTVDSKTKHLPVSIHTSILVHISGRCWVQL